MFLLRLKIHTKKHIYAKSAVRVSLALAIAATRVGSGALKNCVFRCDLRIGVNMSKSKTIMDVMDTSDVSKEDIKNFTKSLNKDVKTTLAETKKLVLDRADNAVGGESSDADLVYNFAYKLRDVLPLKNFMRGRDENNFSQVKEFTVADMKLFTDVVLCVAMEENADTIAENDSYFYRVLRDIACPIIYELKYKVIQKGADGKFFSTPIGRRPKEIYISFSDVNKFDKLKNKYSGGKPADYVSFSTFNAIANFRLLGKENDNDSKSPLLRKLESLYNYLVKNKILSQDPTIKADEINCINFVVFDLMLMLDRDGQFNQIADTLTQIADSEPQLDEDQKEGLANFHKHIGNIHFGKFDSKKVSKVITAQTGEDFLKQAKSIN